MGSSTGATAFSYDVWVILPAVRASYSRQRAHLAPLQLYCDGGLLLAVDVHYRAETDTAILGLHLDPFQLRHGHIDRIEGAARRADAMLLHSARLNVPERRRFHDVYLSAHETRVLGLPSTDAALRVLARHLGILSSPPDAGPPPCDRVALDVRFRRGETWQLGRVCSFSTGGLYVATSVPPPLGATVEVELAIEEQRLHSRVVVAQTTAASSSQAAAIGAAGFGARFAPSSDEERTALEHLLALAHTAGPLVAQPPRRRGPRFPTTLPVEASIMGRKLVTTALDVSREGLFVAASIPPYRRNLELSVVLPDAPEPLTIQGRLVRVLSAEEAEPRRLTAGFGVEVQGMGEGERARWRRHVERVGADAEAW